MNDLYEILSENSLYIEDSGAMVNAVLEYFQGKNKELIKCEGYLANICKKIGVWNPSNAELMTGILKDSIRELTKKPISRSFKDCVALEKTLAKLFGVGEVRIFWETGKINAYTLCDSKLTTKGRQEALLSGKENPKTKINVFVYTETISACGLTPSEVLAILLHEIGHTFYYSTLQIFNEIAISLIGLGIPIILKKLMTGVYIAAGNVHDFIRQNIPGLQNAFDFISRPFIESNIIVAPITMIMNIQNLMVQVAKRWNPVGILKSTLKYGEEKGADSFATRYGYGPELASALTKLNKKDNTLYGNAINKTGAIGNVIGDMVLLEQELVSGILLDPHPNNNQRASSMLKKLKRDLANNEYSPEAKIELEEEIIRMEGAYKTCSKLGDDELPNVRAAIYHILDSITKGHSDFRESFNFYYKKYEF